MPIRIENTDLRLLLRERLENFILRCMLWHVAQNDSRTLADARQGRMKWHG